MHEGILRGLVRVPGGVISFIASEEENHGRVNDTTICDSLHTRRYGKFTTTNNSSSSSSTGLLHTDPGSVCKRLPTHRESNLKILSLFLREDPQTVVTQGMVVMESSTNVCQNV